MDMEFTEELKTLYKLVERTSSNVFLTGKAGTGKTTFLKYLRKHSAKRMVVAAPTGVAAINADGVTLHSLFQLPFEPFIPNSFQKEGNFRFSREKLNIIRSLDLLVIDEISMVRADVLDAVDSVLRRVRRNQLPFGDLQLLLIGDMQQLPPVLTSQEEILLEPYYPTSYFFDSLALKKAGYVAVELSKIYRQSDASFVGILNAVRTNSVSDRQLSVLNARHIPNFNPDTTEGYIRLTTHNYRAKQVNQQKLDELDGPAYTFEASVTGTFPDTSYPTDLNLVLKKGTQVMFVKNDPSPEKAFFNGKIGVVCTISEDNIMVQFPDGKKVDAPSLTWNNVQYELNQETKAIEERVIGSFTQYPLRLAWSITIHKSQGLTFDKVMLDANSAFAHGQVYVALSRCRSLEGLVLTSPLTSDAIKTDQRVRFFSEVVSRQTVSEEQLKKMEADYFEHLLLEQFDFAALNATLSSFSRIIAEHFPQTYLPLLHEVKKQQEDFQKNVLEVALKFQSQAQRYYRANDERLQERVTKASVYFLNKLRDMLEPLVRKLDVQVPRKEIKFRYASLLEDFKLQLKVKCQTLSQSEECFSVNSYLREKALALVDDGGMEQKRRRKTKLAKSTSKQKEPKVPTAQISYELYCSGKTPRQVADERGLALTTIMGHLSSYVTNGKLDVSDFVSEENLKAVGQYLDEHPEAQSFSEVYHALAEKVSYEDIKMVWAMPKYRRT